MTSVSPQSSVTTAPDCPTSMVTLRSLSRLPPYMYTFQPPITAPKSAMRATPDGALPLSVSPVIHLNSLIYGRSDVEYEGEAAADEAEVAAPEDLLADDPLDVLPNDVDADDDLEAAPLELAAPDEVDEDEADAEDLEAEPDDALTDEFESNMTKVYIAGGTYWLPESIEKQLTDAGIEVAGRLAGATAVETSAEIASKAVATLGMSADKVGATNVAQHYDALASAAFCGKNGSVLLLMSDENRSAINSFVKPNGLKIFQGYVFGGTGSMSYDSMKALEDATK